ncbi:hypothetical protein AAVH_28145 [Aphelenchoides avenae]|nr:hypothetical protein AAVH_28145 [Aphelenchus avenae]
MKRKSSDAVPVDDAPRPDILPEASTGCPAVGTKWTERQGDAFLIALIILLVGLITAIAVFDPEYFEQVHRTREQKTARLVVEQLRAEFGTKPKSQDSDGHHVPLSSSNTQTDPVVDSRSEELNERLDRLESLVVQLVGKLAAAEGVTSNGAPTESSNQYEQAHLRRDSVESLLWELLKEIKRPERTEAPSSRSKSTQTDGAAEPAKTLSFSQAAHSVLLSTTVFATFFVFLAYLLRREFPNLEGKFAAKRAEERRQLVEAVAQRLAVEFRVAFRQLASEKKSTSENEYDASFENLEISDSELAC